MGGVPLMFDDIVQLLEKLTAEDVALIRKIIQALQSNGDQARTIRRAVLAAAAKRAFRAR